ncbi:MAG: EAL domain-containing protein, partial [Ferrovum sp.]|nr:EAL domain-containing protein [Ferrovum sp.]
TEQKESEARFIYQANHDRLTGLPNRHLLQDRLSRAIRLAERNQSRLAVLFLDLDNFKWVNDSLGHATGDQLLISVSQRLQTGVRASDTVARLGGDEFVVLLQQPAGHQELAIVAEKLIEIIEQPIVLGGYDFHTTTSIGISIYPEDGADSDILLKHADTAMYVAKASGKSGFRFFDPEMNRQAVARVEVERDLRRAIQEQEFELYFQPKFCLATEKLCGLEALIRWQHPRNGLIQPDDFIPVAEETALIIPLGEWVIRAVCRQVVTWRDQNLSYRHRVAINLSLLQVESDAFVDTVESILEETGVPPRLIEFELTESMVLRNPARSAKVLQRLRKLGIHLALDDFGTGYSSLSHLRQLPLDAIKIDRSFIQNIPNSGEDNQIVRMIVALGKSAQMIVVAEGVETKLQKDCLSALGCDFLQGFLFSRPVPRQELEVLLLRDHEKNLCPPCVGCPQALSEQVG